jgi:hypothetical protein
MGFEHSERRLRLAYREFSVYGSLEICDGSFESRSRKDACGVLRRGRLRGPAKSI